MNDLAEVMASFLGGTKEMIQKNRPILHKALDAANVAYLTITYDGCGDSGSVESVSATTSKDEPVDLESVNVTILDDPKWPSKEPKLTEMTLAKACENFAYDLLAAHHPGWEINDGSFGEIKWQLRVSDLKLTHNERYMEIRTDETTID